MSMRIMCVECVYARAYVHACVRARGPDPYAQGILSAIFWSVVGI